MKDSQIIAITPFEQPDPFLGAALDKAGAFPVLHLGRNPAAAAEALAQLTESVEEFGVCLVADGLCDPELPGQVSLVILPYGMHYQRSNARQRIFYQVHTLEEAKKAELWGADGIIVKGSEGAGKVSDASSYILFQQVIQEIRHTPIYVQGGVGIHTGAALMAAGAGGLVLDSQLALFPESRLPQQLKQVITRLDGNETRLYDGFRVLVRPDSPQLPENAVAADLEKYLSGVSLTENYLPAGQDIAFAAGLVQQYKKLPQLFFGLREAIYGHLRQAKSLRVLGADNALAKALNITYPIAQGPMTRVSDVAPFAQAVAEAGALPFIALSLLKGETALELLRETKRLAADRSWGVGILGFAPQELREEQLQYIEEVRPPVVLIAGGRPSQARPLEKMGIKTFLHVPSVALLEMFLKEGARNFVFEGRECGGHVGPLSSMVLWEKQVACLLQAEHPEEISVFFAGGVHDALSAAFVAVMAAPLAARGIKVGVLMGTAYLYTKEAVSSGAIQEQFQQQALQSADTALLETAPGHETRCLHSPFTAYFNSEKKNLEARGLDKKEIWEKLEKLNVGRLRVAAKGIQRQGNALVRLDETQQYKLGMYMIGQVAALRDKVIAVSELHENVSCGNERLIAAAVLPEQPLMTGKSLDIAIVGMACIFPGAQNLDEYWQHIVLGKDLVTEVPDDRWNKALYYDPESAAGEMSHSKWGGFIPQIDFDPLEYGIPPQSLAAIEPTQLLSLMVARQALEDAGYEKGNFNAENVSVIIGAEGGNDLANSYSFRGFFKQVFGEMPPALEEALPRPTEDSFPGILANVISGRITNRLDLGGRNFTVDAACASSLAALDLACQELLLEKSDMVLAGGADLHNGINDYLMFSSTHALSRIGRCATFDAAADGIALGEGIAMVVLKRKEDAVRDGDQIYAVIHGVGGSSDGKSLGLTAPRKSGQVKALERAYQQAGISPAVLGLVEAHGTGTVVGDRTELSALTDLLHASGALTGQTHLGSVKTQIGHTKCAAGMAGLIKAALAVYHGVKPPTIHLKQPNSYYRPEISPFAFHTEAGLWMEENRYAGVSAFGFGGTNFHAVLSSDHRNRLQEPVLKSWPCELFLFRGLTYADAGKVMQQVKVLLDVNDHLQLKDIAFTLASGQEPVQLSMLADSVADLMMKIDLALSGVESRDTYITRPIAGKVAFLFPGQGSQRINMLRDLFVLFPSMRAQLKDWPAYERLLFPDAAFDDHTRKIQKERIKDTRMAQPLLGIVDLAMAVWLKELGISPDMVAGHSYGELPALCFAGAFDKDQLVGLSEQRAAAILDAVEGNDTGAMIAVNGDQEELLKLIGPLPDIYAVNYNSPVQLVLAGTSPAIRELAVVLKASRFSFRQLEVACAFHSPLLSGAKKLYQQVLGKVDFKVPEIPVWSNTTAGPYPVEVPQLKERLAEHLVEPVRFSDEVAAMYADGARIFIETGPGKTLSTLVSACLGKEELVLHTDSGAQHNLRQLLGTVAAYIGTGRTIMTEKLFEGRKARLLDLNNPGAYKRSAALWLVNGQYARPYAGELPAYGALPVTDPIALRLSRGHQDLPAGSSSSTDQLMQEYLDGMKLMIQSQRDVMLRFLGQEVKTVPLPVQPQLVAKSPLPVIQERTAARPELKSLLLQIVSEKTGYPVEMLGLEMDLEADLSIDSIKRMEIIGALKAATGGLAADPDGEDILMEELAGIKTLSGLIGWLTLSRESTEETPAGAEDQQAARNPGDIRNALLLVVSEKTGYPREMLGMDLDLEADLSIDSIKRMEIIGALQTAIGWAAVPGAEDELMEKLAGVKTLNGLAGLIGEMSGVAAATAEDHTENEETAGLLTDRLSRLRFELKPAPLPPIDWSVFKDQRFAILAADITQAGVLKHLLEKHGASADLISTAEQIIGYDALILLNMYTADDYKLITDDVRLIRQLDFKTLRAVYLVTDLQVRLDAACETVLLRRIQGYTGLFKSLDKEYEHTKFSVVSLAAVFSADTIAELIAAEISAEAAPAEVRYTAQGRHIVELVPAALNKTRSADIRLDASGVVLVLGGAQGITSNLITRFSRDYPCRYLLVGRSPKPGNTPDAAVMRLQTRAEIRAWLVSRAELKTPAAIEQATSAIFKENQIRETLAAMEAGGAAVSYISMDLRDEAALEQLITEVYTKYGRLDGVIHGAGLLEDKLFQAKSPESFQRVFETKVNPLRVLAEQLRPDTQFVIFFSSIASVYGNRGQTDYAAANSVMDSYAWALKEKISGKVLSINWGPWKGAGMVSAALEKEYERRGISLIPLAEGTETFLDELKYGQESQVLIMAGTQW